jgi:kynurenine 3-monooxygenase
VSRAGLNVALMNEAEKYSGVQFLFDHRCVGFDIDGGTVTFENDHTAAGDTIIATDGAGSAVRHALAKSVPGFQVSEVFLEHGYKELLIPSGAHNDFRLEKNALHIWPRHQFMMIALPNFDGSFTCTLFLANEGHDSFKEISRGSTQICADQNKDQRHSRESAEKSVLDFFEREFPDAVALMPTLIDDFFHNPTGALGTVRCWPWHLEGKVLLLGDSAHAMVPFYGQGMNCAFEDVRVLNQLLLEPPASAGGQFDWQPIFDKYAKLRKPNTDAIQDMAEENFYEMRDATADPVFQRKRELETWLEQTYPDYFSKYSMVTFREDLPYSVAKERGNVQDRMLMKICASTDEISRLDLNEVMHEVRSIT